MYSLFIMFGKLKHIYFAIRELSEEEQLNSWGR